MIDGLKITHVITYEDKKFAAALKRFVVQPIIVTKERCAYDFAESKG